MPLLATKLLAPPPRADHVPRPGLVDQLDVALTRPVTLVTAPAGFGKTTLISTWLARLPTRSAWLLLDDDNDDPGRFLDYLLAALFGHDDRLGTTSHALLAAGVSLPAVVTALVNDLAEQTDDVVVVLDDFHVLSDAEVLDAVSFLVEHCPPTVHLVLAGRHEPTLPLARWRGRGKLGEIGAAQLRFSEDEAAALVRSVVGHDVADDVVTSLHERAEGWAAGLQMLAIGLRDRADAARTTPVLPASGDRYVLDYLAEEALTGQPEDVRAFLRRTSVLDRLTPSLCDAVTGGSGSVDVIRRLEQANLFLTPLDDRGEWHRYHGLFADYLRNELSPADAAESHARAARWFAANGATTEAVKHAVAAGQHGFAVETVRAMAEERIRRGELATLLGWLNRLPERVVRANADLCGFKGWLLFLAGRGDDAESYARLAEARMPADAPAADRAMLWTFQAYLALTRNEPRRAAELAGVAIDHLGESRSFFRAAAMGVLGQARRLTRDRRGAIDVLRAAVRLGERSGNPLSTLESTGYLAPLLYVQGRLHEAVLLCEDAIGRYTDAAGHRLPMVGLAEVPLGTLLYERDELDAAKRYLTDGIAHCEQLGTTSYTLLGLRTLARLHVTTGAKDDALRALLAARRQANVAEDHRRARLVIATIAELHLRSGSIASATQALAEIADGAPSSSDYEALTHARVLLARDEPASALDVLAGIEARATEEGRNGSLVAILTVTARARAALGEPERARELLGAAVELAAPDGYRRTFLDEGAGLLPALRDVRAVAPEFVGDLLRRAGSGSGVGSGAGADVRSGSRARRREPEVRQVDGVGLVETLTDTQHRILSLIATGRSNQEVAEELYITVGTTKWHLNQIFSRLQARNRTEAVARARSLGML